MKAKVKSAVPAALRTGKFLYQNRKAEIALVAAVAALVRQVVQAATGH